MVNIPIATASPTNTTSARTTLWIRSPKDGALANGAWVSLAVTRSNLPAALDRTLAARAPTCWPTRPMRRLNWSMRRPNFSAHSSRPSPTLAPLSASSVALSAGARAGPPGSSCPRPARADEPSPPPIGTALGSTRPAAAVRLLGSKPATLRRMSSTPKTASVISCTVWYRCLGSLASALRITSPKGGWMLASPGCSIRCFINTSPMVAPSNGTLPASIS